MTAHSGFARLNLLNVMFPVALLTGIAALVGGVFYFTGSTSAISVSDGRDRLAPTFSGQGAASCFVESTEKQTTALKISPVALRDFELSKTAVGAIDFI